jgi:PAS domain S-box-containing protein
VQSSVEQGFENQIGHDIQPIGSSISSIPRLEINLIDILSEGFIQYKGVLDDRGGLTDLVILNINSSAIQFIAEGYRKEELIGKTMRELLKGTTESDLSLFREVNKTGNPHISEMFDQHSGKWYLRRIERMYQNYFVVILRDITEQKIDENELRPLQLLLNNMINSSEYRIIARDLNERLFLLNDKESEILKIPKNLAIGKTPHDLYPPEIADKLVGDDKLVLQRGKACQLEEEIPIDGTLHSFLANKFPLRDKADNIFGIGIITTDITQFKEAKEALKRREELLQMIFNQTSFGIAIMDLDGKISIVNAAYEWITGYTEQEIISKGLTLFTCARDVKEETSRIRAVASQLSDRYTIGRRVICKNGSIKWVNVVGKAIFFTGKTLILTTIEDITQQKIMERRLEKYSATLEDLLQQRTTQLLNAKRDTLVSNAASLVGQQLLLKYIFRKEAQATND